ncbi:GNAT family N-acetyltransferase [Oryzobacter sp. R7]|uniref:GNAT family N-acetyltransferase n=1 Tax=Oryzobacter faecalis TaxID=3388656 RepID=UPI00398D0028
MTQLATDGVVALRPLTVDDLDAHVAGSDALIVDRLSGGRVAPPERVRDWLASNAAAWADEGPVVDLGVGDVASDLLAGVVGIQRGLDYLREGEVNLTYALYPPWRGRGSATRAVLLAARLASGRGPAVARLVIRAAPDNAESLAVGRRAGFTDAGETDDEQGHLVWLERRP